MDNFFRNEIVESELYHIELQHGVSLNRNECPWDVPLELKVRITERLLKTDWNRYPTTEVVQLQKRLAQLSNVLPDQIVLSNGTNTIIQALINIIPVASKVLVLDPSFVVYELQARLHGNKVVKVPLSEDFELLTERTLTTIKKEKPGIIFIANPNTPTGTLFDKKSLYSIIQTARCPVVIDEAYYPFTAETVMEWLNDFENLIVMRSFSKAVAIAGIRFGFIAAHVDVTSQVEKFLMSYRLSKMTCITVDEILNNTQYIKDNVKEILKERARLFASMQKLNGLTVYPSEANFLLFKIEQPQEALKIFKEENILVRNVDNDLSLKNCLRVTVGTAEENDRFLGAIRKVVAA